MFFFWGICGVEGEGDAAKETFVGLADDFRDALAAGTDDPRCTVGQRAGHNVGAGAQDEHEDPQAQEEVKARPPQEADVHQDDAEEDEQHGDGAQFVQFTLKKHPSPLRFDPSIPQPPGDAHFFGIDLSGDL